MLLGVGRIVKIGHIASLTPGSISAPPLASLSVRNLYTLYFSFNFFSFILLCTFLYTFISFYSIAMPRVLSGYPPKIWVNIGRIEWVLIVMGCYRCSLPKYKPVLNEDIKKRSEIRCLYSLGAMTWFVVNQSLGAGRDKSGYFILICAHPNMDFPTLCSVGGWVFVVDVTRAGA